MSRRVVFDGAVLGAAPITGVGRAFLHTLAAYAALVPGRALLVLSPGTRSPAIPGVDVLHDAAVERPRRRMLRLPALLRAVGADLLHSPVAAIPWRSPCATVATVHDLPWRAVERLREPAAGARHRLAVALARRRADAIVVPSAATAADLGADGPARGIVRVVPHGVPLPATPADDTELRGPFVVLGDDRPRKNLPRVLAAHRLARARCADLPDLLRIGPPDAWLEEPAKHAALRRARALLMLSLHEGYGLPVLEAFGHGVPVLCSPRKSLPELAGDAALYADPHDVAAIAAALCRIHADLPLRRDLARRGRVRAAERTPDVAARAWIAIHDEVLR